MAQRVRHSSIEDDLDKKFDEGFLNHLKACKNKGIPWDQGQTLQAVLSSQKRIEKKLNNPLQILDETLAVYANSMLEYSFPIDKLVFMKNDGTTTVSR